MSDSELFAHLPEDETIDIDVAIIGAGPGGLATAYALLQQGLKVKVFEKAKQLQAIGGALGLFPNAYKALAAIDPELSQVVLNMGVEPQTQTIQNPPGEILFQGLPPFSELKTKYGKPFQWMSWFRLQTAFCQTVPSEIITLNHRCTGFNQTSQSVTVQFEGQKSVKARLVVGADGLNSITRKIILNDGKPIYRNTMSWRGVVEQWDEPKYSGQFCLFAGEGKNFAIIDVGEGAICWTATVLCNSDQLSNTPEESKSRVSKEFLGWHQSIETIIQATEASRIVERGIYDRLPVQKWSQGRITLLGDAAHPMRPALGQGTGMAFEDAYILSTCLKEIENWDIALQQYQTKRMARTQIIQERAVIEGKKAYQTDRASQLAQASKNWSPDKFNDWLYNFPATDY